MFPLMATDSSGQAAGVNTSRVRPPPVLFPTHCRVFRLHCFMVLNATRITF
jgi:hypothetical protein